VTALHKDMLTWWPWLARKWVGLNLALGDWGAIIVFCLRIIRLIGLFNLCLAK